MYNKKYLCIVMNYCCNGDLSSYLKKKRSKKEYLTEEKVLYWFTEICLGLKCIHDNSIVHRDLKTQNIFITGHKNLQIGDFGVCNKTIFASKSPSQADRSGERHTANDHWNSTVPGPGNLPTEYLYKQSRHLVAWLHSLRINGSQGAIRRNKFSFSLNIQPTTDSESRSVEGTTQHSQKNTAKGSSA